MKLIKKIINKIKDWFDFENMDIAPLVAYISNGENLPEPLSPEKEENLLALLSLGDESVKSELIEHNLRLVVFVAKKFIPTGNNIDDLVSIGSIGLIKAVNSFKFDKNIKLATYAARCIENEILMFLRKTQKLKNEVSLDEPIKTDAEGNELALCDVIPINDDEAMLKPIEDDLEKTALRNAIAQLDIKEQEIMNMRFGFEGFEEKTQKEVADALGISQSYISRLEKKIIEKLKKSLEKIW